MLFVCLFSFAPEEFSSRRVKLDVVPCDYVAERLVYGALGNFNRTKNNTVTIIHATAGVKNSLSVEDITKKMGSYFEPRERRTNRRPFMRVVAEQNDPSIPTSFRKDKRYCWILLVITRIAFQRKQAATLQRLLVALGKIETVFSFYTHNTFRFESKQTIEDNIPGFDAADFMNVAHEGIHFFLLGGDEEPEQQDNLIMTSERDTKMLAMRKYASANALVSVKERNLMAVLSKRNLRQSTSFAFRPTMTISNRQKSTNRLRRSTAIVFSEDDGDQLALLMEEMGVLTETTEDDETGRSLPDR